MAKVERIQEVALAELIPYERNAKKHPPEQIEKLKSSIQEFGFITPCIIDNAGNIIAGHGRVEAAKALGMEKVPCVYVEGLTDQQRRAYILADNRLTEIAEWDEDLLQFELNTLDAEGFNLDLIGFEPITRKRKGPDPEEAQATLAGRFLVPPFSVLDSRQKWWQDRKKAWKALGIDSAVGRGNDGEAGTDGLIFAKSHVPPGTYKAKNKIEDALGQKLDWDEFFELMPTYAATEGTSIFDPVLCEIAYRWYSKPGDRILDPFAGGSVRGITATLLGRDYTGIDLSARQIEANRENWSIIPHTRTTDGEPAADPRWIIGDSAKLPELIPEGDFDLLFTCPPYHDLEVYSDDPADISNMSYEDFCKVYSEIISQAVKKLKRDAFAVVVVGDIRDRKGRYRDFVSYTIKAFRDAGMYLYNEGILVTSAGAVATVVSRQFENSRKLGKNHQNVLVFGDARGEVREIPLDDEDQEAEQIQNTIQENNGQLTANYKKILTFAQGDPKQKTAELGPVDMATSETFEVEL